MVANSPIRIRPARPTAGRRSDGTGIRTSSRTSSPQPTVSARKSAGKTIQETITGSPQYCCRPGSADGDDRARVDQLTRLPRLGVIDLDLGVLIGEGDVEAGFAVRSLERPAAAVDVEDLLAGVRRELLEDLVGVLLAVVGDGQERLLGLRLLTLGEVADVRPPVGDLRDLVFDPGPGPDPVDRVADVGDGVGELVLGDHLHRLLGLGAVPRRLRARVIIVPAQEEEPDEYHQGDDEDDHRRDRQLAERARQARVRSLGSASPHPVLGWIAGLPALVAWISHYALVRRLDRDSCRAGQRQAVTVGVRCPTA